MVFLIVDILGGFSSMAVTKTKRFSIEAQLNIGLISTTSFTNSVFHGSKHFNVTSNLRRSNCVPFVQQNVHAQSAITTALRANPSEQRSTSISIFSRFISLAARLSHLFQLSGRAQLHNGVDGWQHLLPRVCRQLFVLSMT